MENGNEYKGWLTSNSFLKRAFAIWGYYMVAHLVIGVVIMAAFLIATVLGFSVFSFFN